VGRAWRRRALGALLLLAVAVTRPSGAAAVGPLAAPAVAGLPPAAAGDAGWRPAELQALLDDTATRTMARQGIAGAVVALVRGGRVVYCKGYGFADLAARRPVSPQDTVFRVASLAKPFTAVAALQQVERGALDLDRDVNGYLRGFQLAASFPRPVTLRDLLVHTAGFDELYVGTAARRAEEQQPLARYLARHMPARVLPPSEVISYSNHGMALAGYLVELASGVSYEQYVEREIFAPLGMRHSGFRLTAPLAAGLATGYARRPGGEQPVPYDYLNDLPAAGLLTTGSDMARFMTAVLGGGQSGGVRILGQAQARRLVERQFSHHPRMEGRTFGFFETFRDGRRVIGHEGEIRGFASGLYLLPEQGVSLFVSANQSSPELREALLGQLLARFPAADQVATGDALAQPTVPVERLAGVYRFVRYPRRTIDKLAVLLGYAPELHLAPAGRGALSMELGGSAPVTMVEVEPGFYQRIGHIDSSSGKGLSFHRDGQGRYDFAFMGEAAYQRLPWYEQAGFQLRLIAVLVVAFLSACLAVPWRQLRRRRAHRDAGGGPLPSDGGASALAGLLGLLGVSLVAGLAVALGGTDPYEFTYGVPPAVRALLFLAFAAGIAGLALPLLVLRIRRGAVSRPWRAYLLLVGVAGLLFVPVMIDWNILDVHF
jgi:CubicO group peptidase (beta-lactamase class C family)